MLVYEKAKPLTGIDLNYEVVGGLTPPTTFRKENTIWINTDVNIGEHEFSYAHSGVLKDSTKTSKATSTIIFHANTASLTTQSVGRSAIFECLPNTNYEIHKSAGNLWYIATTQKAPTDGVAINILTSIVDSSNTINITTGSNANYLVVFVSNASVEPDIILTCLDIIDKRADGSDLQNGDVWIQTDIYKASVSFNAIKNNELMVYPYSLKQWNGNEWKNMAGALYQSGTATLVYNTDTKFLNANSYDSLTGGWGFNQGAKTSTLESTGLRIYPVGGAYTKKAIDLTPYKTLKFDVQCSDGGVGGGGLTTWVGYTTATDQSYNASNVWSQLTSANRYTHSIDVSNVSGNFYLGVRCSNYSDIPMYVYSVIGELK